MLAATNPIENPIKKLNNMDIKFIYNIKFFSIELYMSERICFNQNAFLIAMILLTVVILFFNQHFNNKNSVHHANQ